MPLNLAPQDIRMYDYIGEGYAIPAADGIAAISELARTDALVLDPVYTGKAMAGVLDLARNGEFEPGVRIVFLHTGGAPALFAQGVILLELCRRF